MTLDLAMLSWGSPLTLRNTLESYKYHKLDSLVDRKIIFFQEITNQDREIAKEYDFGTILGTPNNIGIGAAYKRLVEESTGDLFLFLENDWLLIDDPYHPIKDGIDLLTGKQWAFWDNPGTVDVVKLRHRVNPGAPLWSRQYKDNELSRPEFLLDSVHWQEHPEKFPQIQKWGDWYVTQAQYANWTNNPTMFRTDWLRQNIVPRLTGDIERAVQPWWSTQTFLVAQSNGLFTHMRIDR